MLRGEYVPRLQPQWGVVICKGWGQTISSFLSSMIRPNARNAGDLGLSFMTACHMFRDDLRRRLAVNWPMRPELGTSQLQRSISSFVTHSSRKHIGSSSVRLQQHSVVHGESCAYLPHITCVRVDVSVG